MKQLTFTLLILCSFFCRLSAQSIEVPETQRSLVIKHAATWCPPCGGEAWTSYEALLDEYDDEAVFLQAHRSRSSLLYSPNAQDLLGNADVSITQPEFFFNTTRIAASGATVGQIGSRVETAMKTKPIAQTGISFSYSPLDRTLQVNTKTRFFQTGAGEYFLSVFLVLKDTVAFQEARSSRETHKRVLRQALTPKTFGESIASNVMMGTDKTFNVSARLESGLSISKVQIVTVLWRKNAQGKYDFVNANSQGEPRQLSTSRADLAHIQAGFSIQPTVVTNDVTVQLDLPRAYPQLELQLFNLLGQPVKILHRGYLPSGEQRLRFNRPAGIDPGLYLLRLTAGKEVVTRRMYFQ